MLMQAPKEQQSTLLLLFVGAIQDAMKGNDVEATAVMWNGSLFIFKIELFWELRVNIWKQWAHNKSVVYLSLSLNYYKCSLQVYTVFKGQKLKDSMRHFITRSDTGWWKGSIPLQKSPSRDHASFWLTLSVYSEPQIVLFPNGESSWSTFPSPPLLCLDFSPALQVSAYTTLCLRNLPCPSQLRVEPLPACSHSPCAWAVHAVL